MATQAQRGREKSRVAACRPQRSLAGARLGCRWGRLRLGGLGLRLFRLATRLRITARLGRVGAFRGLALGVDALRLTPAFALRRGRLRLLGARVAGLLLRNALLAVSGLPVVGEVEPRAFECEPGC